MSELYTMIRENIKTGERRLIYGHATYNVMSDYWRAYVNEDHRVIIQEYKDDDTVRSGSDLPTGG